MSSQYLVSAVSVVIQMEGRGVGHSFCPSVYAFAPLTESRLSTAWTRMASRGLTTSITTPTRSSCPSIWLFLPKGQSSGRSCCRGKAVSREVLKVSTVCFVFLTYLFRAEHIRATAYVHKLQSDLVESSAAGFTR